MYRYFKDKIKQLKRDFSYDDMIKNIVFQMWEYDEKIWRPEIMDFILQDIGVCALIKTEFSDYTPVIVEFTGGKRYPDGVFKNAKCFDALGNVYNFKNWRDNPEILVIFNSATWEGTEVFERISYIMSEVDTSMLTNVIFSRLKPFPIVHDNKEKAKIDTALDDIFTGKLHSIQIDPDIKRLIADNSNGEPIPVMNLTDVRNQDKIQYLIHYHDYLISRFYSLIGIGTTDNGKQAQISVDEMNKNDTSSMILPLAWYNARKKSFEVATEKTGIKFNFDFSEIWRKKLNEILTEKSEVNENLENDRNSLTSDTGDDAT